MEKTFATLSGIIRIRTFNYSSNIARHCVACIGSCYTRPSPKIARKLNQEPAKKVIRSVGALRGGFLSSVLSLSQESVRLPALSENKCLRRDWLLCTGCTASRSTRLAQESCASKAAVEQVDQ